jgi:hypothetical protein
MSGRNMDSGTDTFEVAAMLEGGAGAPDLERIVVTLSRSEGPAPLAVTFQLRSSDPNFPQFLMFGSAQWRFSEDAAEDYRFRYLDGDLAGERAGTAGGAYVGHVYVRPGVHQWQVTLRYPGMAPRVITRGSGTLDGSPATEPIVVHDPERYFAGRTVYFSNAFATPTDFRRAASQLGIPNDLPLNRYAVGDGAFWRARRLASGNSGPPWRFLIQAGRTYRLDRTTVGNGIVNCFVDRFGEGPDPVITLARDAAGGSNVRGGFFFSVNDENARGPCGLANLDIRGLYDSANPGTVEPWIGIRGIYLNSRRNFGVQIFRCRFDGLHTGVAAVRSGSALVIADSRITNWFNYAVWHGRQDDSAIVGCDLKQKPGTVNTGRKSTAVANTADRTTHDDPAPLLARFEWSLEWDETASPPVRGPRPRANAPAVPQEEAPPRRGGWDSVSPWWKANWKRFRWNRTNGEALKVHDNGRWLNAAVHGPYRSGGPGFRVGIHQCELRSLNGWSRSPHWRRDLPAERQPPEAYAIQPCLRIATAVKAETRGHSTSLNRLALEGGWVMVAVSPQTRNRPTNDAETLPLAVVMTDCILRADPWTRTGVQFSYGRCALSNTLIHIPRAEGPNGGRVRPFRGRGRDPAGNEPVHFYNVTIVAEKILPEGELVLPVSEPGRPEAVLRNILLLNYGRFGNDDDLVAPEAYADLRPGPFGGIGVSYRPGPNSNVLGGSDRLAPYYDLTGAPRPVPAALGAFEAEE